MKFLTYGLKNISGSRVTRYRSPQSPIHENAEVPHSLAICKNVLLRVSLISLIYFCALMTGCAVSNVKDDYELENNPGDGLVIFSLSVSGSERIYLALRRAGSAEQDVVRLDSYGVKGARANYDWKNPVGRLVYLDLSPGQYEIYGWHFNNCGFDAKCLPLRETMKFSVKPMTAVYLGNVHFDVISHLQAYKYEIRDEYQRDISLLGSRLEGLNINHIQKHLLEIGR